MPYVFIDLLMELIFNARKFSSNHKSVIRVALFNSEDNFYMIVSDSGIGMTEGETMQMFTSKEVGTKKMGCRDFGNGGGISKIKLIVGLYDGVVNISSVEGGGTKIIIKIPMVGDQKQSTRI